MKRNINALLLVAAFAVQSAFAQAPAIKISPDAKKTVEGVTAKQLSDYLYFVASDEMEGRNTPSRGLDTTAKFIAMNLSRWGFKPAGDNGTYFQKIALTSQATDPANNTLSIGGTAYKFGDDFFRMSGNSSVNGPLVFAGNGWMIKSKGIDAYKGVDVKDKIVVLAGKGFPRGSNLTGLPDGVTQKDLTGTKGVDYADPVTYARQHGAKAIIIIASPQLAQAWGQIKNFLTRGNLYPEKLLESSNDAEMPTVLVSGPVGEALFSGESGNAASTSSFEIKKEAAITTGSRSETKWTQNVVAIWEGGDPTLKNEMVAIGAHYDHVGNSPETGCRPVNGDSLCNGADDDGSGTVSVLSIAEALAKAPKRPRRSILFVWHCGEEKGLWGSEYFNKFPTVDIKNVIAQLNIDMIGRSKPAGDTDPKDKELSGPNGIYVIGKDMMSSGLGAVVDGTNKAYLNLDYDTRYDDPKDPNRFFFRSDHFNYALNGIPITFWFDGVHVDYHQPGDEPQKIDYAKMEKVARTIMLTMLQLADNKDRPKIDKQLPPELSQR